MNYIFCISLHIYSIYIYNLAITSSFFDVENIFLIEVLPAKTSYNSIYNSFYFASQLTFYYSYFSLYDIVSKNAFNYFDSFLIS